MKRYICVSLKSLIFLGIFFVVQTVLAAPPSSPYEPGETLAPTCAPGDTNCTVLTPIVNSETIYADTANQRVGIGTTTPISPLEIYVSSSDASYDSIKISNSNARGKAGISLYNASSSGAYGGTYGSRFPAADLRGQALFSSFGELADLILASGTHASTGATTSMRFFVGGYTGANERMRLTTVGLGIGTSTPASTLHVNGSTTISSDLVVDSGTLYVDAGNDRVGIGITNPSGVLDLGDGTSGRALSWGGTTDNYGNIFSSYSKASLVLASGLRGSTSSDTYVSSNGNSIARAAIRLNVLTGGGGPGGAIQFFTDAASAVADGSAITPTERMRITSSGNVGIGMISPLLKLDVAGSGRFTGTTTSVLTGSIDPDASTTVTGVGTAFLTELVVGDRITVTGETRTVTAIANNTSLTVDTAFTDNGDDTSPDKLPAIFIARDSSNAVKMVVDSIGNVVIQGDTNAVLRLTNTGDNDPLLILDSNRTSAGAALGDIRAMWNGNAVAKLSLLSGLDTTNKDEGLISFFTRGASDSIVQTRMTISQEGLVGIGTTTPQAKLDVRGSAVISDTSAGGVINVLTLENLYGPNGAGILFRQTNGASTWNLGRMRVIDRGSEQGDMVFEVNNGLAEVVRITKDSRVGIGTTTPGAILDVAIPSGGSVYLGQSGVASTVRFTNGKIYSNNSKFQILGTNFTDSSPIPITFGQSNDDIDVIINTSGFVGIGTTTPQSTLHVIGSSTISNALNVDSGTLYVDAGNDRVGVGTISPSSTLHVVGTSTFMAGNVGIGTATPLRKLHVENSSIPNDTSDYVFSVGGGNDGTLGPMDVSIGVRPSANGANRYAYVAAGDNIAMRPLILNMATNGLLGNIGIGTTTPASLLTVAGNQSIVGGSLTMQQVGGAGGQISFNNTTDANYIHGTKDGIVTTYGQESGVPNIGTFTSSPFALRTAAINRVYVTAGGLVGVSSTNPGALLDVNGSFRVLSTSTLVGPVNIGNVQGQTAMLEVNASTTLNPALILRTTDNSTSTYLFRAVSSEGADRVVIDAHGRMGLSRSESASQYAASISQYSTLNVANASQTTDPVNTITAGNFSTSKKYSSIYDAYGVWGELGISHNSASTDNGTNAAGRFFAQITSGTTTQMVSVYAHGRYYSGDSLSYMTGVTAAIDSYGTGPFGSAIGFNASIGGGSGTQPTNGYGLQISIASGVTNKFAIVAQNGQVILNELGEADADVRMESDANANMFFLDAGENKVGIGTGTPSYVLHVSTTSDSNVAGFTDANGTCTINPTNTALDCSSDERLKTDIQTLESSLERVLALRGVSFRWKTQQDETRRIGFIAQEVEGVIPELVNTAADGYKSLGYANFVPYLVGAIQEQQRVINSLKTAPSLQSNLSGNLNLFNVYVAEEAIFDGKIIVKDLLEFAEESVGQAKILVGYERVRVNFMRQYGVQPIVTVTPVGIVDAKFGVENVDTLGFEIVLAPPQTKSAEFNWHAFGSYNGKVFVSDGSVEDIKIVVGSAKEDKEKEESGEQKDNEESSEFLEEETEDKTENEFATSTDDPVIDQPTSTQLKEDTEADKEVNESKEEDVVDKAEPEVTPAVGEETQEVTEEPEITKEVSEEKNKEVSDDSVLKEDNTKKKKEVETMKNEADKEDVIN